MKAGGTRDYLWDRSRRPWLVVGPWERTPRWVFWRPAWRRYRPASFTLKNAWWEYATTRQRARDALREQFEPVEPLTFHGDVLPWQHWHGPKHDASYVASRDA